MAQEKKRRRGRHAIPYDYEAAFNQQMEQMHEWFVEQMRHQAKKKTVYALKEIRSGDQLEVDIYPQFTAIDDIPVAGRIKKDNSKAQRNLNDKNSRKMVERLINTNFTDRDLWITLTYDDKNLPVNMDKALDNMRRFIRTINRRRKKAGLANARYIYVTEYAPDSEVRWHHHIVMDGDMPMDDVESCWRYGGRNEIRKLKKDENGLSGLATYITKEKHRRKGERRWSASKGLKKPEVRIVHTKRPSQSGSYRKIGTYVQKMVRAGHEEVAEQMKKWYPEYLLSDAQILWNERNYMFYIKGRMRRKEKKPYEDHGSGRKDKTYV